MITHEVFHATMCIVLPILVTWGIIVNFMFSRQMNCSKQAVCPISTNCHKPTDKAHLQTLTVANVGLVATGLTSSMFGFHPDFMVVIGVFYAVYLVYMTADLYIWRKSTKTCFAPPTTVIQWLPPHEK